MKYRVTPRSSVDITFQSLIRLKIFMFYKHVYTTNSIENLEDFIFVVFFIVRLICHLKNHPNVN